MNNNTPANTDEMQVSKKEKALLLTVVITVVIVAAIAIAGFLLIKQGPDTIQGQGEATEIRISGKLPGRVVELYVEEGAAVHAGDTLAHIHSTLADAKLSQADAMKEVAEAADRKVDAGTRSQIVQSAYEVWQQALAAQGIAEKTYRRMEALFQKGVISAQKRDEAKAAYDASMAGARAAASQYDLAKSGAQREDKAAAAAMVRAAQGSINEVDALLEDQYLIAPADGEIVEIYPHVSELVATGAPIMTLQTADHWAVFNMRENFLKNIRTGSDINVYIPALDLRTKMKVFYIRDLGTYANWQATKSTGDYDARTFEVKARPEKKIEGFRPGMSVILEP